MKSFTYFIRYIDRTFCVTPNSKFRRGGGGYEGGMDGGGYEEFSMPTENKGFEDDRGYSRHASFDSMEPERPALRHIDTYCKPECPCLTKRYTVALLACIGELQILSMNY